MPAQKFGGPWSVIKLDDVADYLSAFNSVLKNQIYTRIYIDAFAGSGDVTFQASDALPLFDESAADIVVEGSAKRALAIMPAFHQLHFIDRKKKNVAALRDICSGPNAHRTKVHHGDANQEVARICGEMLNNSDRGVIFLDPFGNDVRWTTLETVSKHKLDVWYLFPLGGVYRNAPIDRDKLTPEKRKSITGVLGTEEWVGRFYEPPANREATLFEMPDPRRRTLNVDGIEAFVTERLRSLFPLVLGPKRLPVGKGAPLFSLFFAMGNKSPRAMARATAIASHILKR